METMTTTETIFFILAILVHCVTMWRCLRGIAKLKTETEQLHLALGTLVVGVAHIEGSGIDIKRINKDGERTYSIDIDPKFKGYLFRATPAEPKP